MAIPRVFVASTCYDLKYIRENLKYFIRNLGYEPVLSEEGAVFYDPSKHIHDSCVSEVPNCQMFLLIIGGRFGDRYKQTAKSITNTEYEEAVRHKVPVFALVEQAVFAEHDVFITNRHNPNVDETKIVYPAVDSPLIFDFIDEVRKSSFNNAIQPFRDFSDIENYLRQQWAGMMFSFLANRNEQSRVADVMSQILRMNDRIEFLSNQILKSVGTKETNLLADLYDVMLDSVAAKCLMDTGHKPSPLAILQYKTIEDCANGLGKPFLVVEESDFTTTSLGEINAKHLQRMKKAYKELRDKMENMVQSAGLTVKQLLESQQLKQ